MSDIVWEALIAAVVTVILAAMSRNNRNAIRRAAENADDAVEHHRAHELACLAADAKLDEIRELLREAATHPQPETNEKTP